MITAASLPPPRYQHLLGMIDDTGLFEHSLFGVPRRQHGYTVDDAARALVVLGRAPRSPAMTRAFHILLGLLAHAVDPSTGWAHNRLGFDRRWRDEPHAGDHNGRALWALGVVAAVGPRPEWRRAAEAAFADLSPPDGHHLRPHALAALGAVEIYRIDPSHPVAAAIIERVSAELSKSGGPWPELRLTYANGRLPHALLALGQALGEAELQERGLDMLEWLCRIETGDGHYSFTPVGGRSPGDPKPAFDQQPIEAAALASAAMTAWTITSDRRWAEAVLDAGRWLTGHNDVGAELYDAATGACYDGLEREGVNANRGAESTLAALEVLQACEAVQASAHSRGGRDPTRAGPTDRPLPIGR